MTPSHPCGTPEARKLGCTCDTNYIFNGRKTVFIPLSCPVHSQFYKPKPTEVTE